MPKNSVALRMPRYRRVLFALHRIKRPRTYLEIGVRDGDSLRLAKLSTQCVGVDPNSCIQELGDRCHIEHTTSDEFFETDGPAQHLGEAPIDMAFIDGMHLFEFVLRDFINIEKHSDARTLLVLHDVIPRDEAMADRQQREGPWTGDVWKVLLILCDRRPDLDICLLDAPPSGLALIQGLDRSLRESANGGFANKPYVWPPSTGSTGNATEWCERATMAQRVWRITTMSVRGVRV